MQTHTFKPDLPPPAMSVGVLGWLRSNLFSNWFNSLLTLLAIYLVWLIIPPLLQWAFIEADWTGTSRTDCTSEGACWVFIKERFSQFMCQVFLVSWSRMPPGARSCSSQVSSRLPAFAYPRRLVLVRLHYLASEPGPNSKFDRSANG